jgi:hypothetical protein
MVRVPINNVNEGRYLVSDADNYDEMHGGSVGSFFKHLGRSIKKVGNEAVSDVGSFARSTANDIARNGVNQAKNYLSSAVKSGINTIAQHPELATTALLAAAGNPNDDMHERLFLHHLAKKIQTHEKKGGSLSGGSILKLAKSAFNTAKKKVIAEAKPHLERAKHSAIELGQDLYDKGKKKAIKFADEKLSQLKDKVDSLGSGVSGGKRKVTEKMRKRNELVKKIMREKGLKMIDASKYIKAHGLM